MPQAVFALVHRLMVRRWNDESRTSSAARSLYAPVALVSLPLVWMILIAFAFTFLFRGTGSLDGQRVFEVSASSLTTLGFAEPKSTARIAIAFVEATIGLGLVASLISYLPTIYSAYNTRGRGIIMLNPIAGIPPTVPDLISTLHQTGSLDSQELAPPSRLGRRRRADAHGLSDPDLLPRGATQSVVGGVDRRDPGCGGRDRLGLGGPAKPGSGRRGERPAVVAGLRHGGHRPHRVRG